MMIKLKAELKVSDMFIHPKLKNWPFAAAIAVVSSAVVAIVVDVVAAFTIRPL